MIFRLIERGVAVLRTLADVARRAGLALAARARAVWRRHRLLIATNATYRSVLATVAAWFIGKERGVDTLMAVITAVLAVVIKYRAGTPPRPDARTWASDRDYDDYIP